MTGPCVCLFLFDSLSTLGIIARPRGGVFALVARGPNHTALKMLTPSTPSSNTTFSVRVPLPASGSAEYRARASGPAFFHHDVLCKLLVSPWWVVTLISVRGVGKRSGKGAGKGSAKGSGKNWRSGVTNSFRSNSQLALGPTGTFVVLCGLIVAVCCVQCRIQKY